MSGTLPLDESRAAALRDLHSALADLGLQGVVIGGVAVSAIAEPRYTADIDAMVVLDTARAQEFLAALIAHGFEPLFRGMADAITHTRVIAVVHIGSGMKVDIALGCMPFEEEVVARAELYTATDLTLRIPTPEDLVVLKAIAGRPKDRDDIRRIVDAHPDLDRGRVRFWVGQYAELMDDADLLRSVETLIESQA